MCVCVCGGRSGSCRWFEVAAMEVAVVVTVVVGARVVVGAAIVLALGALVCVVVGVVVAQLC